MIELVTLNDIKDIWTKLQEVIERTYESHRNLMVLCKKHHEIISSAQRRSLMIQ